MQGETTGGPRATQPPSQATRNPAPLPRATFPVTPPSQTYPPIAGPRLPPVVKYPQGVKYPPPVPAPESGKETAATPGEAEEKWPSFIPFLTRPPQEEAAPAPEIHSTVPPPASGDVVRVALLLPLSGANAELGQAMLNSAQLAVFDFADSRFELLTHDTRGTPEGAVEAAAAAIADGASMIIGPLLAASTRAVGPQARAANVPVVAFSSDRSVTSAGVYTLGFLPSAEIWRIVAYARSKGILRYAALAPDNAYGETVISALEEATTAYGATITQVLFYDPAGSDFSASVRALANYGERRQALLSQRRELEGRDDEVSIRALKRLEKLQTIGELPFEALLVADGGKRLQSIAALLPFYDIDPAKVRMLGTGQWDVPGLGAEPALIGGWFAAPPPPARADFENEYRAMYGQAPPRLATLSYDATALAAVLARNKEGPDFSASAITVSSGFWGRDGIFRFLPQGTSERGLAVMKVGRRGSKIISRAPETFEARIN
ncbi:MAG: penicillin-binding protein activator [Proteobacteria bacterium]|nr:penicillin-binding protein activator [Pseudomonadota bacterium]